MGDDYKPKSALVNDPTPVSERTVNGLRVAFRRREPDPSKNKPWILGLHGFTGQGSDWATVYDQIHALGYGILAPDHPGHGRSEAPDGNACYSMTALAETHYALAEAEGITPMVLLGHSMGGAASEELIAAHPDSVLALILVASIGGSNNDGWRAALDTYQTDDARVVAGERGMAALYDWQIETGRRTVDHVPESMRDGLRDRFAKTSNAGFFGCAIGMRDREGTLASLAKVSVPTLVTCGDHEDAAFTGKSEELAGAIPGAEFALIEDGSHNPQFEAPDATAAVLIAFLEKHFG